MLDFSKLKLSDFRKKVYEATSKIPLGKVATYKQIAEYSGSKKSSRAVGNALHCNPFPSNLVPCHRVIKSNGETGGYAGGIEEKIKMLVKEGIDIQNNKIDLNKYKISNTLLQKKECK